MSCSKKKLKSIYDVAIIGAGAAGLFCAGLAAARGKKVVLIDHRHRVAEKIRISGGGRCNFTNVHSQSANFLSNNPHFMKSALANFTPQDFVNLVKRYRIPFHEKKFGQLFCDNSAQDIINMLLNECRLHQVETAFGLDVKNIQREVSEFRIVSVKGVIRANKLVIATGGLSIPKIGATGFGYQVAKQFGLSIIPPRAGLVPLTFNDWMKDFCKSLSGLSLEAEVFFGKNNFAEGLLFTHRGLSGPSILQISSYWQEGADICINLVPDRDIKKLLLSHKKQSPRKDLTTVLSTVLPKRLARQMVEITSSDNQLGNISDLSIARAADTINGWRIRPAGTEGYRTAEVTLGGVNTAEISSKDMQVRSCSGLYFIGEVLDVTGQLGGHNFQWAWSSAYAAAKSF